MTTEKFTKWQRAMLAAISVVYVLFRVRDLTSSCLWFDEIFGVQAAEHSWSGLFWFVSLDLVHPPLFYSVLKFWISLGGEGLSWLRLLPLIFSVLALVPFLFLCRELKLKFLTTAVGLSFFAWNGSLIKYAQEVRMYSLVLFLSLVSAWLFSRFFFRGKNIWVLALVNVLLVYTHYLGWLLIAAEVLATGILQRIKVRHMLTMLGIATAAYIPWIVMVAKAVKGGADVAQNIGWMERPGISSILLFLSSLVEPFYFQQSSAEDATKLPITIPLLVIVLLAILFGKWKGREDKERILMLLILGGLPIFLAFVLSWVLPVSIWGSRHLIFVFPLSFILVAIAIADIEIKPLRIGLTAAICTLVVAAFVLAGRHTHAFVWCGWEKLAGELPAASGNDTATIYVFEDLVAYHLWYSVPRSGPYKIVKINDIEGIPEDKAYFLPRGFDEVGQESIANVDRKSIWVAFRADELNRNEPPLRNFLIRGYEIKETLVVQSDIQNAFLVVLERK